MNIKKNAPASSNSLVIELRRVFVTGEGVSILNGIDWTVRAGEHWAVLGANGCGKTSLFNTITAYMWPSAGDVFLLGEQYGRADWRELRKSVGIVSSAILQRINGEETALETVLSGKEAMINFWGRIHQEDKNEAEAILDQVECLHLKKRKWQYLSQGERQRVLIGRSLMDRLKVLILDEPCAGLDPAAREKFLTFIRRFLDTNTAPTLIFATHHIEEIIEPVSHVLVLKKGTVLKAGRKDNVLTSGVLSEAFGMNIEIRQQNGIYRIYHTSEH